MKRGDVWTASGGNGYAGKPRPVVIVQDNSFDSTASITVCAFTTDETDAPLIRLLIEPNVHNGLRLASRLMVDKITTVPKSKLGKRIGGSTTRIYFGSIRPYSSFSDLPFRHA